jgi:DNA-binding NarL/FixJ family response regulator
MGEHSSEKKETTFYKTTNETDVVSTESGLLVKNSKQLYNIITLSTDLEKNEPAAFFSEREKAIIKLICQERSSKQISVLLSINQRTIERVRTRILKKMKVKSAAGIAIYALRNGLLTFQELINKAMTLLFFMSYLSE